MFDAVLNPERTPGSRWGGSAFTSLLVHAGLLAVALLIAHHEVKKEKTKVAVTFVKPHPVPSAAPPPPPPPPPKHHKTIEHKIIPKNIIIPPKVVPKEKPPEKPQEEEEADDSSDDDGVEGGVVGGVKGGVVGGVVGGVLGGQLGGTLKRVDWDPHMGPAKLLSGANPDYTPEAREHEIEGVMQVKCVIGVDGSVRDCKIIKGLPFMNQAAIDALQGQKRAPYVVNGEHIEVNYLFTIRLRLPIEH